MWFWRIWASAQFPPLDQRCKHAGNPVYSVQVMLSPIVGMVQAHGLLTPEERKVWMLGLAAADISIVDAVKRMCHQEGGRLAHSELLAGGWDNMLLAGWRAE